MKTYKEAVQSVAEVEANAYYSGSNDHGYRSVATDVIADIYGVNPQVVYSAINAAFNSKLPKNLEE